MGGAGLLLLPALWHLGTGTSTQPPARNLSSSLTGRVLTSRNISTVTPAPGLAELPSHRHNEPDIPSSGTKEIPNESTSPSKTNIGGSSVCQTVCSVGWPATSLLSLGACVGSLVAPAITGETALTVCPAVMIAWGAAKGVFDLSLCPSLCGNVTVAARRVDSAQLTESLYDMTGLYVHPEYSLLSPAIYLARVLGGLALSLQEDRPENRALPREMCETVCSLGQPVISAVAVASCGASLQNGDTFMESDLTKPSVICPLVTLMFGMYSSLVSPALCTGTCQQARMTPTQEMLTFWAALGAAFTMYKQSTQGPTPPIPNGVDEIDVIWENDKNKENLKISPEEVEKYLWRHRRTFFKTDWPKGAKFLYWDTKKEGTIISAAFHEKVLHISHFFPKFLHSVIPGSKGRVFGNNLILWAANKLGASDPDQVTELRYYSVIDKTLMGETGVEGTGVEGFEEMMKSEESTELLSWTSGRFYVGIIRAAHRAFPKLTRLIIGGGTPVTNDPRPDITMKRHEGNVLIVN